MNNHNLAVAVWLFNRNLLCAEPVLKFDIMWIQLNTQQRRETKCTPVNRMAYASCPVSHWCTKRIYIYITRYEGLDKSQEHSVLSIWSRSGVPSPRSQQAIALCTHH